MPAACLVLAVAASVGFPACGAAARVVHGFRSTGWPAAAAVDWSLMLRSLLAAGAVAALATLLAIPVAWTIRGWPARWAGMAALPMLLPSYLAYAALNLLRAPGTPLGDWLLQGPLDQPNLRPVIAARTFAVLGLALWAWPLPLLVMLPRLRRIDRGVMESLRLEPLGPARRSAFLLRMTAGPVGTALALTTLVMLGSAVPFHLAQLDTYAVRLWRTLNESAPGTEWIAWTAAWPLAVLAVATAVTAAWVLPRRPVDSAQEPAEARGAAWPGVAAAGAVWSLSVLLPLFMFARNIGSVRTMATFWRSQSGAIEGSVETSAILLVAGTGIAVATALSLEGGGWARRVCLACIGLWLVAGLMPGVLVGSATATAWNRFDWTYRLADTPAIVVVTHLSRYGFLAALLGWWMHRTDPLDERELRLLDGADHGVAWFRAAALPQLPVLVGGCLAVAVLGFHEIEASVFVQPPGYGRFSQVLLELLHYERRSDLAAAVVTVTGAGLVAAVVAGLLTGRRR